MVRNVIEIDFRLSKMGGGGASQWPACKPFGDVLLFKFTYMFIADTDIRAVVWLGCGLVGLCFSLHAMLLNNFSFKLIFYGPIVRQRKLYWSSNFISCTYVLYIHIMYLFNMLLHYIICYYYYEIGNKNILSYPILPKWPLAAILNFFFKYQSCVLI